MSYNIEQALGTIAAEPGLAARIEATTLALVRLDERLRRSPDYLSDGLQARWDFTEAQAVFGLSGTLLSLDDLVLREADMPIQTPSAETGAALAVIARRRSLRRLAANEVFSAENLAQLTGSNVSEGETKIDPLAEAMAAVDAAMSGKAQRPPPFSVGRLIAQLDSFPIGAAAMILHDQWRIAQENGSSEQALLLTSAYFRHRGLTGYHTPPLGRGLWHLRGRRWEARSSFLQRMDILSQGFALSAAMAWGDCDKLTIRRKALLAQSSKLRRTTTADALIDLFIASPVVTIDLAARKLKVTPQAIAYLLKLLNPALPPELTSRKRYKAWGII